MHGIARDIIRILQALGLEGFPLFVAACGVSIVILMVAYLNRDSGSASSEAG